MGCKIVAFRFEGELKQEPKYVAMETSARLTVLFFGGKQSTLDTNDDDSTTTIYVHIYIAAQLWNNTARH